MAGSTFALGKGWRGGRARGAGGVGASGSGRDRLAFRASGRRALTRSSVARSAGLCAAAGVVTVLNVMLGLRMYVFISALRYGLTDRRSLALSGAAFQPKMTI